LDEILSDKIDIEVEGDDEILYTKDGTIRQRNRTDSSRSKKVLNRRTHGMLIDAFN
jgi:hypothetical protein